MQIRLLTSSSAFRDLSKYYIREVSNKGVVSRDTVVIDIRDDCY